MAVEDKYSVAALAATPIGGVDPLYNGYVEHGISIPVAVAAADDDGSVYRLYRDFPANAIITRSWVETDGITNGTAYHMGFHASGVGGAAVDNDVLMASQTLAVASTTLNGLGNVAITNRNKTVAQLLGLTAQTAYPIDLTLTGATVGTAAGNILVHIRWIMPALGA